MDFRIGFRPFLILALVAGSAIAHAQAVDVTDKTAVEGTPAPPPSTAPREEVGEEATARKYFRPRRNEPSRDRAPAAAGSRYLSIQLGPFISENSYKWGDGGKDDVGQFNVGVTYKVGEWTGSMDLDFKADIITYSLTEGRAVKLSMMPAVVFPDAESNFPLYFGAGAGLGVFLKQIEDESSLSFDYSIFAGARFYQVLEDVGFLMEAGMKNHVFLLSDGQFNGVYFDVGAVFQF